MAEGVVTSGAVFVWLETNRVRIASSPTTTNVFIRTNVVDSWNYYLINGTVAGVQGMVQGKVMLLATNTISISSNILYWTARGANDPWGPTFDTNLVTDSMIMASPTEVIVDADPRRVQQVDVHSAIMVCGDADSATDRYYGFCARNNDVSGAGVGQPVIRVYGTLTQYRRGLTGPEPAGASDEPPPNKGFGLHVKFDPRFVWDDLFEDKYSAYWWTQWRQVPP